MASALEEFRAQRQVVEDVRGRLTEVAALLASLRQEMAAFVNDEALRTLLAEVQTRLVRAQDLVGQVERFREREMNRFWPATWRRWAMAVALAVITAFGAGAGYVWAVRPYEAEIANVQTWAELGQSVAQRVVHMTPTERRQFDALMNWTTSAVR